MSNIATPRNTGRRPWFADLEDAERRGARGCAGIGYFDCDCDLCRRRHLDPPF